MLLGEGFQELCLYIVQLKLIVFLFVRLKYCFIDTLF